MSYWADWAIVGCDVLSIIFCGAIALWFSFDLRHTKMASIAMAFLLIGFGIMVFALPQDFMFALYEQTSPHWFMMREWSILPWRVLLVLALSAIALILRFGDWNSGR